LPKQSYMGDEVTESKRPATMCILRDMLSQEVWRPSHTTEKLRRGSSERKGYTRSL